SDDPRPPGRGRGTAVSLDRPPPLARAEADRRGADRRARRTEAVGRAHRDGGEAARRVLPRRSRARAVLPAPPGAALLPGGHRPQAREAAQPPRRALEAAGSLKPARRGAEGRTLVRPPPSRDDVPPRRPDPAGTRRSRRRRTGVARRSESRSVRRY